MKTLKKKIVRFEGEREVIKLKQLNEKDKINLGLDSSYIITFGEYEDIDMEADNIEEAQEQFKNWGK